MESNKVIESARILMKNCMETSKCATCPLYKKEFQYGYCMIEGLSPWEWEIDNSVQTEKGEKE